jgi:hypothetical protein
MTRWKIVLVALTLSGCGGMQVVDGGTHTETNTVSIPIGRPCYVRESLPVLPTRSAVDMERATTDQLAAAYAADVEMYEEYAKAADKLLQTCVRSTSKPGESRVVTKPLSPNR